MADIWSIVKDLATWKAAPDLEVANLKKLLKRLAQIDESVHVMISPKYNQGFMAKGHQMVDLRVYAADCKTKLAQFSVDEEGRIGRTDCCYHDCDQ